ncbi:MAG TPA: ABC transporter substrate-binding protein [Polyangia bacterium]|nr:ABC transporter substrate-binding protein [Polyangia bacterium]
MISLTRLCASLTIVALLSAAAPAAAGETLTVWWVKGFYKSEDDALFAAIKKFEEKTGVKVELSQYPVSDMIAKTVAALDAGNVPDVAYSDVYDLQTTGKWAFEGKLEDLTSILAPQKDKFLKNTLETTHLYNDKTKKHGYYAFPVKQQTMHIQYWKDMLTDAGFKESDIPTTWKAYWDFWCDKVQPAYRAKTGKRTFAVGQPMGVDGTDSFYSFLTWADAWGAKIVDENGKLVADQPKNRAALVNAMKDFTGFRTRGCTPPSSTAWKDPDNNVAFHNKTIILTDNASISIVSKWLDDANNASLPAEQRATAKKNYEENIVLTGFPHRPDGSKMFYRAAVKTGVIFEASKNKKLAKDFVTFLMQPENLQPYVEGALGRWFPVTKAGAASPFWSADAHRRTVEEQFKAGTTSFEFTKNWKFTQVNSENVWAKCMSRILNDNVPVEKAVDEMIARIKTVIGS